MLVAEDRLDDPDEPRGDRVVRGALALDDLVRRVAGVGVDAVEGIAVVADPGRDAEVPQRHARDVRGRPHRDLGVTVLTGDVGVDRARIHAVVLGEEHPEAGGVEDRP